jgi:phosphate transport system protein
MTDHQHIVSSFDRDLEAIQAQIMKMGGMVERAISDAARLLALRAPTANDLRLVLTVIKISGSLERIGDYAKNIAKRTSVLSATVPVNGSPAALRRMAREVEEMLKDALDAYIQRDADLAHEVINRDEDVDQMYNAIFREFLTFMMEDPRNITPCMHLHFIAKNTERMGDLVTSIAEQVIYLVTGKMPEEPRPKADRTSTDPSIAPS